MTYHVKIDGRSYEVQLTRLKTEGRWRCRLREDHAGPVKEYELDVREVQPELLSLLLNGRSYDVEREVMPEGLVVSVERRRYSAEVEDARSLPMRRAGSSGHNGPRKLTAPMPGRILRVLAPEGASVEQGQAILVIEAMKMQNELKAPKKGVLRKIMVGEGAAANAGDVLAIVD